MQRRYFGTDGIRGRVGTAPITPDFVLRLGWAAGKVFARTQPAKILIGKDTRISGYMLESALEAGLSAAGVDVHLLGPMPTPAIAYLTRTFQASAGIVISASHNPFHDNGIKFFGPGGQKLGDEVEQAIEQHLDGAWGTVASERLGKAYRVTDAPGRYIEFCKASAGGGLALAGMKVVLDCANGATYQVAPKVFAEMGATVSTIGTEPNGLNINDGCGATDTAALVAAVQAQGADLGVALDGDGDRLMLVDRDGAVIDGDQILWIIASHRHRQGRFSGGVVGTVMSNLGLERAFGDLGIPFLRAAVGDRHVLELLHREGWVLGGESSGHVVCLDQTTTGDGIISALQVLQAMAESGLGLRELAGGMEKYPQTMVNVRADNPRQVQSCPRVAGAVADIETRLDGRGRVLLRPSGTEPVVRVMVEGQDAGEVNSLAEELAGTVQQVLAEPAA